MGKNHFEENAQKLDDVFSMDDNTPYREPNSIHITDDWDTMMEDFIDDFDDYRDVNFPTTDDDY